MKDSMETMMRLTITVVVLIAPRLGGAFEGHISIELIQRSETNMLLYTVRGHHLRIENLNTNWPHSVNLVDIETGDVTLIFPHNRTLVRLKNSGAQAGSATSTRTQMPPTGGAATLLPPRKLPQLEVAASPSPESELPLGGMPPGIGPQTGQGTMPPMIPAMPISMMPMPAKELELKATGEKKIILGQPCAQYEIKLRGETIEVWATDQLLPLQMWLRDQRGPNGPRQFEQRLAELLKPRKLFPLLVSSKLERGQEHPRFRVKSITPEKVTDEKLFQPPDGYHELQPLPF